METSKIQFPDIEILVTSVALLNITRTASKLGVSKGHISKRIRYLETSFGKQLFIRTNRIVRPTPFATMLAQRFSEPLKEFTNKINEATLQLSQGSAGKMIISATHDVSCSLIASAIPKLKGLNVGSIDFICDERPINFFENNITVAIRINKVVDDRLIAKKIGEAPILWVSRKCAKIDDPDFPIVLPGDDILASIGDSSKKLNFDNRRNMIHSNSLLQNRELIQSGYAFGPLPMHLVSDHLRSGNLQIIPHFPKIKAVPFFMVYLKNPYFIQSYKQYVDALYSVLKSIFNNWTDLLFE